MMILAWASPFKQFGALSMHKLNNKHPPGQDSNLISSHNWIEWAI